MAILIRDSVCVLVLVSTTLSQHPTSSMQHGTIAIVYFRPDQLTLAVDSKISVVGDSSGGLGCKVVALGQNGLFLSVGIEGLGGDFISTDLAQEAYRTAGATTDLPKHWGELITKHLNRSRVPVLQWVQASGTKTMGFFGFEDGVGRIHLYTVEVPIERNGKNRSATFKVEERSPVFSGQFGDPKSVALIAEALAEKTARSHTLVRPNRANTPERDLQPLSIAAILDAVIQWSPGAEDISRPVDVAVLEPGSSVRWVRRKNECYAKDH